MEKKKKCVRVGIQGDRISDLPDTVLHHIYSFLPLQHVAQTCVLSKRWLRVWHTYPILDFSPFTFGFGQTCSVSSPENLLRFFFDRRRRESRYYTEYLKALDKYTNFVDYKLQNFCNHNLEIHKFNLSISICGPKVYHLIDKWIGLLREKHVKRLKLSFLVDRINPQKVHYFYPSAQKVFGIKSLTELSVQSVETVFQGAIKHKSLVTLSLKKVCFDGILIFDDQNLPCIRFISLSKCFIPGGLKVSCRQLQEFNLYSCRKLDKIEVFAPALSLMSYSCRMTDRPSFFSLSAPSKLLSLRLSSYFSRFNASWLYNLHTSWFVKMKEFVLQMQNQTRTLDLCFFPGRELQNTFDIWEASRRCGSPPYVLKCLSLEIRCSIILDFAAFMDGLFWSFRPEILSISCICHGQGGCLVEFLCKTFEGREDDDHSTSKFWWQWSNFKVKDIIVKDTALCWARQSVDFYLT